MCSRGQFFRIEEIAIRIGSPRAALVPPLTGERVDSQNPTQVRTGAIAMTRGGTAMSGKGIVPVERGGEIAAD